MRELIDPRPPKELSAASTARPRQVWRSTHAGSETAQCERGDICSTCTGHMLCCCPSARLAHLVPDALLPIRATVFNSVPQDHHLWSPGSTWHDI
ncbi:hypothetical protein CALVIDRAFT_362009 [Calocera viscosa TUFC12733]|uniref:Uncharacterized protein n=1 Tax=Calocera viscosa (strain TUFC12733) TaxID=1330018 RepID=A0A167H7V4_CALVF|nr:hypothetical protein CALVIDRAFT_362009 [Calocera viscosa TUFC12733]